MLRTEGGTVGGIDGSSTGEVGSMEAGGVKGRVPEAVQPTEIRFASVLPIPVSPRHVHGQILLEACRIRHFRGSFSITYQSCYH